MWQDAKIDYVWMGRDRVLAESNQEQCRSAKSFLCEAVSFRCVKDTPWKQSHHLPTPSSPWPSQDQMVSKIMGSLPLGSEHPSGGDRQCFVGEANQVTAGSDGQGGKQDGRDR